jgi:anti-sigma factor RsiW
MNCESVRDLLDDYVDGALPEEAAGEVRAHVAVCAECRQELERLESLLTQVRALPTSVDPPADMWDRIEARLAPRSAARIPRPVISPPATHAQSARFRPRWLQLAAAAMLLMAVSSAATVAWLRHGSEPRSFTALQAQYARATVELAQQAAAHPENLSPETRAVLDRNLAIIDDAIREAEQALNSDRGNPGLERMLLARYQQRLELLQRATKAGEAS